MWHAIIYYLVLTEWRTQYKLDMTTRNAIYPDTNGFRHVKQEHEGRLLTHTCPHCSVRYPNSGSLVQHINAEHLSFVTQANSKIARVGDQKLQLAADEKYKNTIATCPFCQHDCQTRKKLMMHLQTEHKDDNDHDHDEESKPSSVKIVRIEGPFVTPGASESNVVQNLIKVISGTNGNITNGNTKIDKSSAKLQYKCFWCDASFRKRGKLMDHIDTLHKHNKQQSQMQADMLNTEDLKPLNVRPLPSRHMQQIDIPSFLPVLPLGTNVLPHGHRSPYTVDSKPQTSNAGSCSFTLAGSLTKKSKPQTQENTPPNMCKFYLGKKGNPLASKVASVVDSTLAQHSRRFSLPNLFDNVNTSTFNFSNRMLSPTTMTAALQHSYMMNIRPQLMNATQFYAPRMPLMMPSSEYLLNHAHPSLALNQQPTSQQVQLLARMNAAAVQRSPLATSRPKTSSESPLDLTKNYI